LIKIEQETKKVQNKSLYPTRVFEYVDRIAIDINKLLKGETEKIKLTPEENKWLSEYENSLGEKLEKIFDIPIHVLTLYLDYFVTTEGKTFLRESAGLELKSDNPDEIRNFMYKNSETLQKLDGNQRKDLSGRTVDFSDDRLFADLFHNRSEAGELNINRHDIPIPQRFQILADPEKALMKISALRDFKKEIKQQTIELGVTASPAELEKAQLEILGMYQRKVNTMIAGQYSTGVILSEKKRLLGKNGLTETENKILSQFSGLLSPQKNRSRMDKFLHGTSEDFDENGNRVQISASLKKYAEDIAAEGEKMELSKREQIKERGIDPDKLLEENIVPEQRAVWGEETLASQGLKSEYGASTYDPDRTWPAPDGKWQYILMPGRKSMDVSSKQKVVLDSAKQNFSMAAAISVACGHEMIHVLQHENKQMVPLRLLERIGGSKSEAFAEGGDMHIQDKICRKAFGFGVLPHPHYVRAMLKKLEGGNYVDCIKAFYESSLVSSQKKLEGGQINHATFHKESASRLKQAINRAKRLFADGISFDSEYPFLTHSKDTVYLEQTLLVKKLEALGLEKFAYVGGVGLDDLRALFRLGRINLSEIKEPSYYCFQIWEREKSKYLLRGTT